MISLDFRKVGSALLSEYTKVFQPVRRENFRDAKKKRKKFGIKEKRE